MRKTFLKVLSVILSAALLIGAAPVVASAATEKIKHEHSLVLEQTKNQKSSELKKEYSDEEKRAGEKGRFSCDMELGDEFFESDNWAYTVVDSQAIITGFYSEENLSGRLDVPDTIDGYPVTGIYWIDLWYGEVDLYIPASVKEIDKGSFGYGVKSINVDVNNLYYSSVDGVLYNKDKTILLECPERFFDTIVIPDGVKEIASNAFISVETTQILLPEGLERINDQAFASVSGLVEISIPASVTYIGESVFAWCYSLEEINIAAANTSYVFENGVLFNIDKTVLKRYLCTNEGDSYTVPDTVTVIENNAFEDSRIACLILPASLERIGECAFGYNDNLSTVEFKQPSSLKVIGAYAFDDCGGLEKLILPEGVERIEPYAFGWTGIKAIYIPASVTAIDKLAFEVTDTKTIYFGGSEAQWTAAVQETDPENYSYEDDWYYIEFPNVVYNADITPKTGNINDNITWHYDGVGALTVKGTGAMPEYPEYTGNPSFSSFAGEVLSITVEEGITGIDGFYDMADVMKVEFPQSLERVSGCAFNFEENLWNVVVTYKGLPYEWEEIEFGGHDGELCTCVNLGYEFIYIDNDEFEIDEIGISVYDSATVKFGETVILEADIPRNSEFGYKYLPVGTRLEWYFAIQEGSTPFEGDIYDDYVELTCIEDGKMVFEVYLCDEDGFVTDEYGNEVMASVVIDGDAGLFAMISYLFRTIFDELFGWLFFWL